MGGGEGKRTLPPDPLVQLPRELRLFLVRVLEIDVHVETSTNAIRDGSCEGVVGLTARVGGCVDEGFAVGGDFTLFCISYQRRL